MQQICDNKYFYFQFNVGEDVIKVGGDMEPRCCENVDMYIVKDGHCGECTSIQIGDRLVGNITCDTEETFTQITDPKCICNHTIDSWSSNYNLTFANYIIPMDNGVINVVCYNISNGFYSHNTRLYLNEELIFDVEI